MKTVVDFEKIYKTADYDLKCPSNCRICEDGFLQLLPGEAEYISSKYKIPKHKLANKHKINKRIVWMIMDKDEDCHFYECGRCIKRDVRSLDCRTYPVIPFLKNNKLCVKLDIRCPLVKKGKISDHIIKKCLKSWRKADPPQWWMKIYEENIV